jgi:hypothetical protein
MGVERVHQIAFLFALASGMFPSSQLLVHSFATWPLSEGELLKETFLWGSG